MLIGLAVQLHLQSQIAETRFLGSTHTDFSPSVLQRQGAFLVRGQQVGAHLPLYHTVARHTIQIELHLHGSLLPHFVEPVGMVGHSHPQIVTPVRIVLHSLHRQGTAYKCQVQ